jgi:hypothetical protein
VVVRGLYRHIIWQDDSFAGTDRLGLLIGEVVPIENDRDFAAQTGFFSPFSKTVMK